MWRLLAAAVMRFFALSVGRYADSLCQIVTATAQTEDPSEQARQICFFLTSHLLSQSFEISFSVAVTFSYVTPYA
jgi:hypothetical protein